MMRASLFLTLMVIIPLVIATLATLYVKNQNLTGLIFVLGMTILYGIGGIAYGRHVRRKWKKLLDGDPTPENLGKKGG